MAGISGFRKGNVFLETMTWMIIITIFALVGIIGYNILGSLNDDIQNDSSFSTEAKTTSQNFTNNYPNIIDNGFMFLLVLIWIAIIVTSFFLDTHPIFFVISIILLPFILFVGATMANIYDETILQDSVNFPNAENDFAKINWVFEHILYILLAVAASTIIALYGKSRMMG